MAESSSTSTAAVAKGASVREAIDSLNKWRTLSPIERSAAPFPDAALETLIAYAGHALNREGVNSRTSGVPPSQDQNRQRGSKRRDKGKRKPSGQPGHKGTTAEWSEHPDVCVDCAIDFSQLPEGRAYRAEAPVLRQSIDIVFTKIVAEFRLERVSDESGRLYTASIDWSRARVLYMASASGVPVPLSCAGAGMTAAAAGHGVSAALTVPFGRLSYGLAVRALAVEFNVMQMLPLARESELFRKHLGLTLSQGFIVNACRSLAAFLRPAVDELIRRRILMAPCAHFDETGISIDGKLHYIHVASGDGWVFFHLSPHRGREAMEEIGILPVYGGIAVHDCWASYFLYLSCMHALCGAHLLRDLQGVVKRDGLTWAAAMKGLLLEAKEMKEASPGQKLAPGSSWASKVPRSAHEGGEGLRHAEGHAGKEAGAPEEEAGRDAEGKREDKGADPEAPRTRGRGSQIPRRTHSIYEQSRRAYAPHEQGKGKDFRVFPQL